MKKIIKQQELVGALTEPLLKHPFHSTYKLMPLQKNLSYLDELQASFPDLLI